MKNHVNLYKYIIAKGQEISEAIFLGYSPNFVGFFGDLKSRRIASEI